MIEYQPGKPTPCTFQMPGVIVPAEALVTHLTLDNDGSTSDMRVDGSSVVKKFQYVVPTDKLLYLDNVEIVLLDASIDPALFGGLAALTNGCKLEIYDTNGTTVLLDMLAESVKSVYEFSHLGGVTINFVSFLTNDMVSVSAHMHETYGADLLLEAGQIVQFTVQDNLATGLVAFEATIGGRLVQDRR